MRIPLSAFAAKGLNLDNLTALQFAFEFGAGSGRLWVDNILIGSAGAPQADRRVLYMQNGTIIPLAVHMGGGDAWKILSNQPWLVATASGVGPATVTVTTYSLNNAPGVYQGTLTILGAEGQSEQVDVFLTATGTEKAYGSIFLPALLR